MIKQICDLQANDKWKFFLIAGLGVSTMYYQNFINWNAQTIWFFYFIK